MLQNGDLLIEKSGGGEQQPVGAVAQYDRDEPAVSSNFLARIRARPGFHPRFLTYVHASLYSSRLTAKSAKQTTGIQNLDLYAYLNERFSFPSYEEQQAIANYLDKGSSEIDGLVAKKQRLIELLDEKRNSLIARAITQGLDRSVPMKDSGVPWLGRVPKHWEVKRLGRFCFLQRGHDLPDQERENGKVPILSSAGISGHHIRAAAHGPAVVTGRYGSIGQVFYVDGPFWPLNTTLYSVSLFGNDARYVKFMLEHLPLASDSEKSAVPGVNRNYLHTLEVACPPIDEQAPIAEICLSTVDSFRALSDAVQAAIERLREYRSALITAAVTGQLDIPQHEEKMEALT